MVTAFFLLSRCSPAAAASGGLTSDEALSPAGAGEETQDDEGDTIITNPFPNLPLQRRRETAYLSAAQHALMHLGFTTEFKRCCMRLQREAEAVDEAAWRRLLHQSALVQQTLDGPLSASAQFSADLKQPQQQAATCSSQPLHGDGLPPYNVPKLQQEEQQQQQEQQQHQPLREQQPEGLQPSALDAAATALNAGPLVQQQVGTKAEGGEEEEFLDSLFPFIKEPQESCVMLGPLSLASRVCNSFRFRISRYTQRLHVFSGDTDHPMGLSLAPVELATTKAADHLIQQQQLQSAEVQTLQDHQAAVVREAARRYWHLFRFLSSFEQRRFREASLTVQQLQVYVHRRQKAQQHGSERPPLWRSCLSEGTRMAPTSLLPFVSSSVQPTTAEGDRPLPPRHTTNPLLLLQSAQQQQQLEQQLLNHLSKEQISPEGDLERPPDCSSGGGSSTGGCNSIVLPFKEDEPDSSMAVSSRYFSSPPAARPPGPSPTYTPLSWARPPPSAGPSMPSSSSADAKEQQERPFILIPAVITTPRAASKRTSPVSQHMQPFCLERQTLLCVSCMKPLSAISTTRTLLRPREGECDSRSNLSDAQPGKAETLEGRQLSGHRLSAEMDQAQEQISGGDFQPVTAGAAAAVPCTPSGVLWRPEASSQQYMTGSWNFTADGAQGCFIRCTEQDLTCSGRCLDAYAARRRRKALRRQVRSIEFLLLLLRPVRSLILPAAVVMGVAYHRLSVLPLSRSVLVSVLPGRET